MEGVMQSPLLRAFRKIDAFDVFMTPFLRITTGVPRRNILKNWLETFGFEPERVIVQLMGCDPVLLARAAQEFDRIGVSGINFNFGCPSSQVLSGGAGGAALKKPSFMAETVARTRELLPEMPLSVKLRSGYSDPDEMYRFLPRLAKSGGLDFIVLHYRTVEEQYGALGSDVALERWGIAAGLADPVKLYINGDLDSAEKALPLLEESGAYGVMSARGLMRDPLLGRRIESVHEELPPPEEARELLWETFSGQTLPCGWLIEVATMLFGAKHQITQDLKKEKSKMCRL